MVYRVMQPTLFDDLPELGMGFHFGQERSGRGGYIVLNAEYAIHAKEIGNPVVFRFLAELRDIKSADIVPSQNVALFLEVFHRWLSNPSAYVDRRQLHQSPPFSFSPQQNDRFVRFSAFSADRRVGPRGSLRPGSYATSSTDTKIATGYGNVGRYALPNLLPAIYAFDITVPNGTPGLIGTVSPAFGQAGGGVEIEWPTGAPAGSVQGPATIPAY
jgi:hypothetical protein